MEVGDIHVGKQLACVFTPQGLNPTAAINPFNLADGSVCGTAHFNGGILVGSGKFFPPAQPLATTMLTRPSPDENPRAITPSILYIRNSVPPVPTPIDVVVGDPVGPVGVTMVCSTLNITTATLTVEIAPLKKKTIALEKATGAKVDTGAQVENGVQAQAGAEARASAKAIMGPTAFSGTVTAPAFVGTINPQAWKGFDIKHPNKVNHRLRHICLEGPEAGVYFRGKLNGTNIIKLPEYWKGLIDYDTITVNLTPYGIKDELFVKDIHEDRIIVSGNRLTNVKCFYDVHASRIDGEPLIVEYEGSTPADYPGSADQYSISGFDYGRNQ